MHHCVGTYADNVTSGDCYVYSVRRDGRRIATAKIVRTVSDRPALEQIRGPCNAPVPKKIVAAVRRWLHTSSPELERPKQAELDDIPF